MKLRDKKQSIDGTVKLLWETKDKNLFESVGVILDNGTYNLCISSQIGCNLGCQICDTSNYSYPGKDLSMSAEEIIQEAIMTDNILKTLTDNKIDEIGFMGMGEPFNNLNNVIIASEELLSMGYNISISTVGIIPKLKKFIEHKFEKYPRLQISVHGIKNRTDIIPINKLYNIEDVIRLGMVYASKSNLPLTLNWVLLPGINDTDNDIERLAEIADPRICRINVSSYIGCKYKEVSKEKAINFIEAVKLKSKINYFDELPIKYFQSLGADIEGGCGQLVGKFSLKK